MRACVRARAQVLVRRRKFLRGRSVAPGRVGGEESGKRTSNVLPVVRVIELVFNAIGVFSASPPRHFFYATAGERPGTALIPISAYPY